MFMSNMFFNPSLNCAMSLEVFMIELSCFVYMILVAIYRMALTFDLLASEMYWLLGEQQCSEFASYKQLLIHWKFFFRK